MRLIGTLNNENEAKRFANYLKQQDIDCHCEVAFDAQTGYLSYHLWIHNEDEIQKATAALESFRAHPTDAAFDFTLPPPNPTTIAAKEAAPPRPVAAPITSFFLSLCIFIFLLSWYQQQQELLRPITGNLLMTPVDEALFFDLPPKIDDVSKAIEGQSPSTPLQEEIAAELKALDQLPYWRGAYDWFLDKMRHKETLRDEGPLFYRIRSGEYWRLFTPVLLHGGFLHILFNMIWLWVLGIPIEQRIGFFRTLGLTLLLGIGSNVCQYLMGGPFFIGYSGIVVGLAGFIWSREKVAPWEGYPLQKTTILFLLLFVGGMFAIQFTSFILQLFTSIAFSPNIANTGHIAGGLIGIALGRMSLFARSTIGSTR